MMSLLSQEMLFHVTVLNSIPEPSTNVIINEQPIFLPITLIEMSATFDLHICFDSKFSLSKVSGERSPHHIKFLGMTLAPRLCSSLSFRFKITITSLLHVFVYLCGYEHEFAYVWRSENYMEELASSFCHVHFGDPIKVFRFGGTGLHPLNHRVNPLTITFCQGNTANAQDR